MRVLLIVYDNGSHIHTFPLGTAYIAAALRSAGVDVEIYNQDVHHYPDEHLTSHLNKNRYDIVGVGVIGGYYPYKKLLKISQAIGNSKNKPFYVLGGHGPSPEPEYFLKKTRADAVVMGEGEVTIVNLANALAKHLPLSSVKGIAYRDDDKIILSDVQPLIKNIDLISWPAYDLFPVEYYRIKPHMNGSKTDFVMYMLSGRGCPFRCNFCYRMDDGVRLRSGKAIVEEVLYLKREYGITYINFADELLMTSVERIISLCDYFIKSNLNIKWSCNGRLNYAKPDLMKYMKHAGCVFVNFGIESMDDNVLKLMNKNLTVTQIKHGVEATLESGISPGLNIIFGNIGENIETLEKGVQFLLKYDDGAQLRTIRPVIPYPGSELYYMAIQKGLLVDVEDFYENKNINTDLLAVNFTELKDDEIHKALLNANIRLIENYFNKKKSNYIKDASKLYLDKDVSFRGFRQT